MTLCLICDCICVFMYVQVHVHTHAHCVVVREQLWMSFLPLEPFALILFLLRGGASHWPRSPLRLGELAGGEASGILFLPPQSGIHLAWLSLCGFWGLNTSPHEHFANRAVLSSRSSLCFWVQSVPSSKQSFRMYYWVEFQSVLLWKLDYELYILIDLFNGYFSSACPEIENRREMVLPIKIALFCR